MDIGTWAHAQAERLRANRKRTLLFAGAAVVIVAAVLVAVGSFGLIDLQIYRFGALAVLHGDDLYGPLPLPTSGTPLPFIYPPFAAVVFTVMAIPPLPVAAVLMDLISLAALWVALHAAVRRLWRPTRTTALIATTALTVAALALEPVRETITFGQINLVLMALVAVDCLEPNPRWPRGLGVGIAAAIKVTPAGFLLFFLLTKDFRAARNALVAGAAATALGFLVASAASVKYFFGGGLTGAAGLSGSPYATNQTIEGALHRLNLPSLPYHVLWLGLSAFVVCAAAVVMRRVDQPLAFVVNATAVLVLSPISWSHHWVWIAPALLVLATRVRTTGQAVALAVGALVFVLAPHSFVPSSDFRELAWTPWQHVIGDSYLLLALGFLTWQVVATQPASVVLEERKPFSPLIGRNS
ncbi:glycosyltransferase 87 family protein [Amycolatopsis carbonis]|uniref:Glycosyltransferase 87 family protein n=1 Tax=Amycolatopsis carbonis TaxID=715471 RepID=A0A9Y2IHZ3_9PSEU|nr:glycosyltransferase 87 family protein [Amycolatopsis sp. 2-15]WIX80294.1 glycosyltransferase 87 family protein [Amycolatopsis sp. 2-15]